VNKRLFGLLGTIWVVLGPIAALWLAVQVTFGGVDPLAEAIAAFVLLGPPIAMLMIYKRNSRMQNDHP